MRLNTKTKVPDRVRTQAKRSEVGGGTSALLKIIKVELPHCRSLPHPPAEQLCPIHWWNKNLSRISILQTSDTVANRELQSSSVRHLWRILATADHTLPSKFRVADVRCLGTHVRVGMIWQSPKRNVSNVQSEKPLAIARGLPCYLTFRVVPDISE